MPVLHISERAAGANLLPASTQKTLRDRLEAREIALEGKDGRCYVARPIRASDAPSLMRGYDALSVNSKWFRMLHTLPHLTEEMAREFCTPDPACDVCIVLEGWGKLEGEILGGARITGSADGAAAEFSVSLRPEVQGLGLARQALETIFAVAREMGYRRLWGTIHEDNEAMANLAEILGFHLRRDPEDGSLILAERDLV